MKKFDLRDYEQYKSIYNSDDFQKDLNCGDEQEILNNRDLFSYRNLINKIQNSNRKKLHLHGLSLFLLETKRNIHVPQKC